ncbi:hypothetical protein SESBI_23796, partial [Sesbania bispinosa]
MGPSPYRHFNKEGLSVHPNPNSSNRFRERNAEEGRNQVSRGGCSRVIMKNQDIIFLAVRSSLQ